MTEGRTIQSILGKGKDNAITGKALAGMLGMDHRSVTKLIEAERRKGVPICASCDTEQDRQGYFLAETQEELDKYLAILKSRAIEILKTRQAILKRGNTNGENHI